MTTPPRIAAIMAVRNGERWLGEAVGSILTQTFGDFELVIVDNGSTDTTPAMLAEFARADSRITLLSRAQPGLADCLRLGIARSSAPLIARLDADDVARSDRFQQQIERFDAEPGLGLLGSQATIIDGRSRAVARLSRPLGDGDIRSWVRYANPFCHSSVMMRREVYDRAGGYRAGIRYGEDWDLWLRMARLADMANCEAYLVSHRVHAASLTQRNPAKFLIAGLQTRATAASLEGLAARTEAMPPRPLMRDAFALVGTDRDAFRVRIARHWAKQRAKRLALLMFRAPPLRALALRVWR